MSWTDPTAHVYTTSEVVSSATLTTYVQANLSMFQNIGNAVVATSETTTSSSYTDLATSGPAVTWTSSGSAAALVSVYATMSNNTLNKSTFMAFAVSGATTLAAGDATCIHFQSAAATLSTTISATFMVTGLNAGANVFTAKYRVDANTGTFSARRLGAVPLPA